MKGTSGRETRRRDDERKREMRTSGRDGVTVSDFLRAKMPGFLTDVIVPGNKWHAVSRWAFSFIAAVWISLSGG